MSRACALLLVPLVIVMGCSKKETNKEKLARYDRECHAKVDPLVAAAKPRVEAFRKMLEAVDTLPPPVAVPAEAKLDPASIPILQRDFVKARMASTSTDALQLHRYGVFLSDRWFEALAHAATFDSRPHCERYPSSGGDFAPYYADLAALTHVVIVKPGVYQEPQMHGDKFVPGHVQGVAYVFDVGAARPIGGFELEATNSDKVDFTYRGGSGEKAQDGESAVVFDLGLQVDAAIRRGLGAK